MPCLRRVRFLRLFAAVGVLMAGMLTACTPRSAAQRPAPSLRVMTYNIQAGGGDLASIAAVIRGADVDLAALQEVDVHWNTRSAFADQAEELARMTGLSVRFAPIYTLAANAKGAPAREYGVALLSRFPVVRFTNHQIPRLSTQLEMATPLRMPGLLEAVVDVHGVRVRVFNTHLDYRGDPAVRRQQVTETLSIIGDAPTPVLLLGDLNASPAAPELRPLFARLHDTWLDSSDAGFTYPAAKPVRRIDYVLASSHFRTSEARVLNTQVSDHRPVVLTLTLTKRP